VDFIKARDSTKTPRWRAERMSAPDPSFAPSEKLPRPEGPLRRALLASARPTKEREARAGWKPGKRKSGANLNSLARQNGKLGQLFASASRRAKLMETNRLKRPARFRGWKDKFLII